MDLDPEHALVQLGQMFWQQLIKQAVGHVTKKGTAHIIDMVRHADEWWIKRYHIFRRHHSVRWYFLGVCAGFTLVGEYLAPELHRCFTSVLDTYAIYLIMAEV